MSVNNSYIGRNQLQPDGKRHIHEYHESDTGRNPERFAYTAPVGFDIDAQMAARVAEVNASWADAEVDEAITDVYAGVSIQFRLAVEQPQSDFDRRVLGRLMLFDNLFRFSDTILFFQQVEIRAGNPPAKRYLYLGVTSGQYDLIEERYNEASGVAVFMDAEELRVWPKLPDGWD